MRVTETARRLPGGLIALLFLLLAACATAPQTGRLIAQPPAVPHRIELTEVPFFAQEAYQCGPAALATTLQWAGLPVSPEDLVREVYLPARQGSLQIELVAAARRRGLVPYVLPPRLDAVLAEVAAGHPVVVLQNLALAWYPKWHYAVVVGYDLGRAELVLRSGLERRHALPLDTFERTWARGEHWALVVLPPGNLAATAEEVNYLQAVLPLERLGLHEPAAAAYHAATERWPHSLGAWMGLGNARYALEDRAGAEAAYRAATRARPDAGAAHNNLAQTLADQGRWHEAESAATRAVALGGPHIETYRRTLADIRMRLSKGTDD